MNRHLFLALVAATIAMNPVTAAEDQPATNGTPYLVVVGVGEFADPQIHARPTAEADARALYQLFTDPQYLGVDPKNAKLFLSKAGDKAEVGTRTNIMAALKQVAATAGKNDPVIIALVGQGAALGERTTGYFAQDTNFRERIKTALSAADVKSSLEKLKSEQVSVLIDINYKGFDPGKEAVLEPNMGDILKAFIGGADEKEEEGQLPSGRAVFLASRSPKASIDLKDEGLFTKILLEALKGKADTEGYEPDGLVTVDELTKYLDKKFPDAAREYGTTKEQKEQSPLEFTGPNSHFPITYNPAVRPLTEKRLAALAKLTADGQLSAEIAAEGRKFLSRMPKLEAQKDLRKQYQALVDGTITVDAFNTARDKVLAKMKLDPDAAEKFARGVYEGIDLLRDGYVKELKQGQLVSWAVRGLYKRLEEKMPANVRDELDKSENYRKSQLMDLLIEARTALGDREDLDGGKDVDIALQMMMAGHTDPYTTYIDKDELNRFKTEIDGRFTGIGIQIRRDAVRDGLLVVTPIRNSPAYRAGLLAGDLITEITQMVDKDGEPLATPKVISTKGLDVSDAVKVILGLPGTKVKVKVVRQGVKDPMEFEIIRGLVEVETVLGVKRTSDDSWDFYIDPKEKIGYIRLTQFGPRSAQQMKEAVEKLDKAGLKGLVLDLRFNPGGLLTAAVSISDLFIEDGLIVSIRPRIGREKQYGGEREGSHLSFPLVCLINSGSASGSEIVAAALQDHNRAVIMGERSYGKGSVQNIQDFPSRGAKIKLTTASFWRPNGKNLSKAATKGTDEEDWGVRPDPNYVIKLEPKESEALFEQLRDQEIITKAGAPAPTTAKKDFKDRQLETAIEYLKSQIKLTAQASLKKAG